MLRARFLFAAALLSSGVALADHLAYRLSVNAWPAPVVGQASRVFLRVYRQDGSLVRAFDDLHTQPMHLIAVSQDLEDFQHVHPRLAPWYGYLSTRLSFSRAMPYTLFAEYDPAGPARERTSRHMMAPAGATPTPAHLDPSSAFDGELTRRVTRGTTRVSLVGAMGQRVRADVATSLHVQVDDTTGAAADLQDYMGMPAHAIVVSQDLRDFLHLHGMFTSGNGGMTGVVGGHGGHGGHGGTTPPSGATAHLTVEVTFPRAGLYKLWVQVQRAGRVITVPFVVRAL